MFDYPEMYIIWKVIDIIYINLLAPNHHTGDLHLPPPNMLAQGIKFVTKKLQLLGHTIANHTFNMSHIPIGIYY